jgi:hypothetical protein
MKQHLQQLLATGATITLTDGYQSILADAAISDTALWFFQAFGEDQTAEHVIEFAQAKINGNNIDLLAADGLIIATIAPIEIPEDAAAWQKWKSLTEADTTYAAFIARLKTTFNL